jgi:hypothetical protein
VTGHSDDDTDSGAQSLGKKVGLCACVIHANVAMESLRQLGKSDEIVGWEVRDYGLQTIISKMHGV